MICTPEYIVEKFGIEPERYADFKSLTGDASDNINGAEKVGPKTAALLLCEFGDLERIILNAEAIKKPSVRSSIIRNSDRLRTNYKLIKLNNSEPLPFTMDELIVQRHNNQCGVERNKFKMSNSIYRSERQVKQ